jgi:hypothetical protein
MVKYARIVFEDEIPEGATSKEALSIMLKMMKNHAQYLTEKDVEISEYPYERME